MRPDPLDLATVHIARQNIQTAFSATMLCQYRLSNPQVLSYYVYALNNPVNSVDPEGLEVFLFGRTPWFYRIPILRKFSRTPQPGGLPRITQPRIKPASPRAKLQPPEKGAINPSDRAFPHDPGADTLGPMGGVVPPVIIPEIQEDDPCEEKKPFTPWEEIPEWMKA